VVIKVREVPAAAEAREKWLQAIATEAHEIMDKRTGQASAALEELAHAYAVVTSASTAVTPSSEIIPIQTRAGGHQVGLCLELEP
jgi:hypothetical protein